MADLNSSPATLSQVELDLKNSLLACIGLLQAHEKAPGSVEPTKLRLSSLFIHLVASNSTRNVEEAFSTQETRTAFSLENGPLVNEINNGLFWMRPPVWAAVNELTVRFTQAVKPILDGLGAIVSQDNLVRLYAEASAETFHDDMKARAKALREQKQREAREKLEHRIAAAATRAAQPNLVLPPKPAAKKAPKPAREARASTPTKKPEPAANTSVFLPNVDRSALSGGTLVVKSLAPAKPARTAVSPPSPRPAPTTLKPSSGAGSRLPSTVLGVTAPVASPSDEAKVLYLENVTHAIKLLEAGDEKNLTRNQMFWVLMVASDGSCNRAASQCDEASAKWLREKNQKELLGTGKNIQKEVWQKDRELIALGAKCRSLLGHRMSMNLLELPVSK